MGSKTFLIAGLGNPGPKYYLTRHNIGFLAIDHWAAKLDAPDFKNDKKSLLTKVDYKDHQVLLVKPQTFMNLSGESILALMTFYRISKEDILIIQDDLDMPFGAFRFFFDRSPGGHNGIKNIHEKLGSQYSRLKIGIKSEIGQIPVDRFVLMNFNSEEQKYFQNLFEHANASIEAFIDMGHLKAANQFNKKLGYLKIDTIKKG